MNRCKAQGVGPAYAGLRSLYKAGLFAVFDLQIVFWGRQGVLTTEAANSSDPAIRVLSERRLMYDSKLLTKQSCPSVYKCTKRRDYLPILLGLNVRGFNDISAFW